MRPYLFQYIEVPKGSVENLASSFRLDSGKGVDYDWDGLKRVYEDIEAKDLENSLVEAIGELYNSINKTKSKIKIVPALVMVRHSRFRIAINLSNYFRLWLIRQLLRPAISLKPSQTCVLVFIKSAPTPNFNNLTSSNYLAKYLYQTYFK